MIRPAATAGAVRMLHCSPDRTLFVATEGEDRVVRKIFVRGSLQDAEREVQIGRQLAHLGVAQYREAKIDEGTNRPCVLLEWHDGSDLGRLVAEHGAIPASRAAALLEPVARTLAAMHALEIATAPRGVCHGDIKPSNLLADATSTLVLDFEHARAITGDDGGKRIMGTAGFASPEALKGAVPDAAIDVFGLGATLRWLLAGGHRDMLPQDAEVEALVRACTAEDPQGRPSAASVARSLTTLKLRLADDPAEAILSRLAAGERLEFVSDSPRHAALQRLAARQRRLIDTLPDLLETPTAVPRTPAGLHVALRNAQRVLRHFPQHGPALQWRANIAEAARELLAGSAATISSLQRGEDHDDAARWLEDASRLTRALMRLPGPRPIPGSTEPRTAGLVQRDPLAFLARLRDQLAEAQAELGAAIATIDAAEERLDLVAAEKAIKAMAERYGGSSPTAARRRDQLHRLAFYLDRIACAQANVERLGQTWNKTALEPLAQFVTDCARSAPRKSRGDPTKPLGLRSLQVTLVNLGEEFPHLYLRSGPALEALSRALQHTSDLGWELVAEARRQLDAVPVPVRPLQITLGRLDTFRILEALIDRPERPRGQLLDSIESLRLKFEQARSARDHLAQGAEQAMARGHWTTGLFDMERAVAGLNPNDDQEREEALRLEEKLTEARRKKRELEAAVRRNVELGNRYGLLQDDATSTFTQRLEVLTERRTCLRSLAVNLPAERAELYASDLREVELQIALEQAGLAETEFDANEDPEVRQRLASQTLDRLKGSLQTAEFGDEPPGRLLRMLEHWRTVVAQCQRDTDRQRAERELRTRARRRMVAVWVLSLVVALTTVGWAAGSWLWGAATSLARNREVPPNGLSSLADRFARLEQGLPAPAVAAGDRLLTAVRLAADPQATFDPASWHAEFDAALCQLRDHGDSEDLRTLASAAWHLGLSSAVARSDSPTDTELLTRLTTDLARRLEPRGIVAPLDVLPGKD